MRWTFEYSLEKRKVKDRTFKNGWSRQNNVPPKMFLSQSLEPVTVLPYMMKALSDVIKLMVLEMGRVSWLLQLDSI